MVKSQSENRVALTELFCSSRIQAVIESISDVVHVRLKILGLFFSSLFLSVHRFVYRGLQPTFLARIAVPTVVSIGQFHLLPKWRSARITLHLLQGASDTNLRWLGRNFQSTHFERIGLNKLS